MKIALTSCLVFIASLSMAQTNLMSFNSGFEDNDPGWSNVVDDWFYKRWGESTMYVARDNASAHAGSYGVSVNIASTGGLAVSGMAGLRREVTGLTANTTYKLSFWIRSANAGSQQVAVSVSDYVASPSVSVAQQTLTYDGDDAWHLVEMLFTTDVPGSDYSQIRFDIDFRAQVGIYHIDDFALVQTVVKSPQSIVFDSLGIVELGDPDFYLHARATSGLPVEYASTDVSVAAVTDSTVTILADGITYITASQAGDADFDAAEPITRLLRVVDSTKLFQTITFDAPGDQVYGGSLTLNATSDAAVTVSYRVVDGPAEITGNVANFTGIGQVSIRAMATGNSTYNAALPVTQTFNVLKAPQTINITPIPDLGVSARPYAIEASASSGLPLTFDVSGPATLMGDKVAPSGTVGTVVLRALQAGNEYYENAVDSVTFNIVSCETAGANCFDGIFHVAKNGDDANPGTAEAPFLTIQKAAEVMLEGEECVIHEGVYRETVRPKNDGVAFRAAAGEKVTVSAFEAITGWQKHQGAIYKATIPASLGDQNMVMYHGQLMNLARWPNKTNYNPFDLEAASGADGTLSSLNLADIPDQDFETTGVLWFLGFRSWSSWRRAITGNTAGSISFATLPDDWYYAGKLGTQEGGEFILYNTLPALDANGEWYANESTKTLYFQGPAGEDLTTDTIDFRQRTTLFDLTGRSNISLEGLKLVGGNLILKGASGCHISQTEILYGNHSISASGSDVQKAFRPGLASILMDNNSTGNIIERSNIQWGAACGIILSGNDNIIRNNYIGNFNYIGAYSAPIRLSGKNTIEGNEIFNGGRDLINGGGNGTEIGYNNMYGSNLIDDDCGAIYMCCGKFGDTHIHHNWIHDIESRDEAYTRYKGAGIYLDNSTEDVIVDHNVTWNLEWTGVQINWAGVNLLIYNNTLWSTDGDHSHSMAWWENGYQMTNVPVYNTLANDGDFVGTDIDKSVVVDTGVDPFMDFEHLNFMPSASSPAIDAGRTIDGYTDGFIGEAPDAGAYERGKDYWVPGPDWIPDGQLGSDCNGESGGSAYIDKCGNCVGGNTGISPETGDCPQKKTEVILGLPAQNQLRVHPNPTGGVVRLNGVEDFNTYVVTDLRGRFVLSGQIAGKDLQINLQGHRAGCYLLRLQKNEKERVIKLIMQ